MFIQDESVIAFPLRTVSSDYARAEDVSATDEKPRGFPIDENFVCSHTFQHSQQIEAGKENAVLDFAEVQASIIEVFLRKLT
jgi:hypothetical protein